MNKEIANEIVNRINNITDERKKKLITSILKKDNWYVNVSFDTAISILMDLGYSKEEAILIFKQLILE